jgi:mannose-6-phosphate isomerase-like protein (cupin superfamily)
MTEENRSFVLGPGEGQTVHVLGDPFTYKVIGANTGGAYAIVEATVSLHGPPLHVHHNEDEAFYVVEGAFDIQVGERTARATAGSLVFGPKGVPHAYVKLEEGPAKLLEIFSPAGFERFFKEISGLSDIEQITRIAAKYRLEILGPPLRHQIRSV